jgi:hypothetical protein
MEWRYEINLKEGFEAGATEGFKTEPRIPVRKQVL